MINDEISSHNHFLKKQGSSLSVETSQPHLNHMDGAGVRWEISRECQADKSHHWRTSTFYSTCDRNGDQHDLAHFTPWVQRCACATKSCAYPWSQVMVFPYLTVEETECAEERHQPRSEAPGECWPDWDPQPRCTLLLGTDVSRRLLDRTMTCEMPTS